MTIDIDVREFAKRPPQHWKAVLRVDCTYAIDRKEVPEKEARFVKPVTSRVEDYSIDWFSHPRDHRAYEGREQAFAQFLTKLVEDMPDEDITRSLSEGTAEFGHWDEDDLKMHRMLLATLAARAYILEESGHHVSLYRTGRLNIEDDRIRVVGKDNTTRSLFYDSEDLRHSLPRIPNLARAESCLNFYGSGSLTSL